MKSSRLPYYLTALCAVSALGLLFYGGAFAQGDVTAETGYKRIKPPGSFGTVLMERNTKNSKAISPVLFPHWAHRSAYTCKVCHIDLGFAMKAANTDIKQSDIEAGKYCGKCHNGTTAFGPRECDRCHSYGKEVTANSKIEGALKDLPKDDFGNKVNWAAALKEGKIKPRAALEGKNEMTVLDKDIVIPVTKLFPHPPDVLFPHKAHTGVLDCSSCHPTPFNQKAGGNPDMSMMKIISGQYCGECHGKVAFPQEDCFRCHSQPPPKAEEPAPPKEEKAKEKAK